MQLMNTTSTRLRWCAWLLCGAQAIGIACAESSAKPPTVKDLLSVGGDNGQKDEKAAPAQVFKDKYQRDTPRSSVQGLAKALDARDYQRALLFMDMRNLPAHLEQQGQELARELKIVADNAIWVSDETLSAEPGGQRGDGLPSYRDRLARIEMVDGPTDLLLQRVPGEDGQYIWKISNQTVAMIPRLYQRYGYGPIGDNLSQILPEFTIFGMLLWQWVMLVGILLLAYFTAWLLTFVLIWFFRLRSGSRSERRRRFIARPVRFLIMVIIIRLLFEMISPSVALRAILEAKTLLIIAFAWVVMGTAGLILGKIGDRMKHMGRQDAVVMLRPTSTAINVVILLVAVTVWLDNLGFKVTTLMAGLGVGSIAVALAAQKSIENLIGAVTIFAAQPVRVGDFCRFGDTIGTVEEIGLRSTIVRTLARTLVTVPNATFSSVPLENFARRDKFLYRRLLRLRPDTSPDQIRYILIQLRELLYAHPSIEGESAWARFVDLAEHSFDLEVFAYVKADDWNGYLAVAEDINLRVLDVVAEAGTRIALPAQSLYMEKDSGLDVVRADEAAAQVAQWRQQDELGLPEFSAQKRAALKDTLDYPPRGSVKD